MYDCCIILLRESLSCYFCKVWSWVGVSDIIILMSHVFGLLVGVFKVNLSSSWDLFSGQANWATASTTHTFLTSFWKLIYIESVCIHSLHLVCSKLLFLSLTLYPSCTQDQSVKTLRELLAIASKGIKAH